jgi:hypothetical protein
VGGFSGTLQVNNRWDYLFYLQHKFDFTLSKEADWHSIHSNCDRVQLYLLTITIRPQGFSGELQPQIAFRTSTEVDGL